MRKTKTITQLRPDLVINTTQFQSSLFSIKKKVNKE